VQVHAHKNNDRKPISMCRLALLAVALLLPAGVQAAETRIALVVGNSAYASGPLLNPANDARLVAQALSQLGFEVIERRDADQNTMKRAIQEFGERLDKGGPQAVGLFYYAGHGVQLNGRNYLIPTKANIEREGDVEIEAVSADWVIEQMRYARNRLNIVILDACRNNPFNRSMRSADRGLASMDAPAGILIAYSTAPGAVAEDGSGRNSPYTTALTRAMLEVHQPLEQVFKHVRADVMGATAGKQVPWEASSLTGEDYYFNGPAAAALANSVPTPVAAPSRSDAGATGTGAAGSGSAGSGTAGTEGSGSSGWFAWVSDLFSSHTSAAVRAPTVAPAAQAAVVAGAHAVALLRSLGIDTAQLDSAHDYSPDTIRHLIASAPRRVALGSTPEQIGAALALCKQYAADCQPRDYADERLRQVTLAPFELDATPVSVRAFRQFADGAQYLTHAEKVGFAYAMAPGSDRHEQRVAGGSWRNALKQRPLDDDSAVVGVSFQDAEAYCRSRSSRLPSEDEWEYAARGPQDNIFPWGDDFGPTTRSMNIAPHVTDGPVGGIGDRYRGLSGNVWQWVDTRGVGSTRVLKGGSWLEPNPANKRAATRRYELPDRADADSGFRCARTLPVWPDADVWMARLQ
jgi:formylglycine-generating enzyme required for sulfatase activity